MPKILKQTSIYKSKLFNIFETKIQFGDRTFRYEVISGTGSGAVMIIPIIDKSIIFIKEYAAAVDDYMITLPKGKIDDKETIYQAAGRELQEEIGYKSDNIKYIQSLYLAPGYIDHITYMMLADKLSPSSLTGDEPENLEIIRVKLSEINLFLDQQKIVDSRVYAAINYLHKNYEKL